MPLPLCRCLYWCLCWFDAHWARSRPLGTVTVKVTKCWRCDCYALCLPSAGALFISLPRYLGSCFCVPSGLNLAGCRRGTGQDRTGHLSSLLGPVASLAKYEQCMVYMERTNGLGLSWTREIRSRVLVPCVWVVLVLPWQSPPVVLSSAHVH